MKKKDWKGNKVSYSKTLGASNHSKHERETHDYYATEPKATELLLELEKFNKNVWECACGEGHISNILTKNNFKVESSDLIDRNFGKVYDFLNTDNKKFNGDIITNPPYRYVSEFITKSLSIIKKGNKVAFFLPIRYLEGKARKEIYAKNPPIRIWVSSSRLKCAMNGNFDKMKGSAVSYAWFVWQKGYKGKTQLDWFN